MKKETRNAYIALGLVSFFWGTTYIASRIGAQHIPGLFVAGVRQFLSGLILVSFFLLRGHKIPGHFPFMYCEWIADLVGRIH
jgi:drug/metabolite transporter (DMT)-like permease